MEKIWHFWKQSWKFQLAMLLFNVCVALILVPIAFFFNLDKNIYYLVAIPVYILVLVPIGGFLSWVLKPSAFAAKNEEQENA